MKLSETLLAMADKLQGGHNDAIVAAEDFGFSVMGRVAIACVHAASILRECAQELEITQNKPHLYIDEAKGMLKILSAALDDNVICVELFDDGEKFAEIVATAEEAVSKLNAVELPEDISATVAFVDPTAVLPKQVSKMGAVADVLDTSADSLMTKQASVLDELLLSISAPAGAFDNIKAAQAKQIDTIKQLYKEPNEKIHESYGAEDAKKAIQKSEYFKELRPLEAELSTRYCPDHPGTPIGRVGTAQWQCALDHKVYDFESGFTDERGRKHPPGGAPAVAEQTKRTNDYHSMFDTRDSRLNRLK